MLSHISSRKRVYVNTHMQDCLGWADLGINVSTISRITSSKPSCSPSPSLLNFTMGEQQQQAGEEPEQQKSERSPSPPLTTDDFDERMRKVNLERGSSRGKQREETRVLEEETYVPTGNTGLGNDSFGSSAGAGDAFTTPDTRQKSKSRSSDRRSFLHSPAGRVLTSTPIRPSSSLQQEFGTFGSLGFSPEVIPEAREVSQLQHEQNPRREKLQLLAAREQLIMDGMAEDEQIHLQQMSLEERQREAKAQEERRASELADAQKKALEEEIARLQAAHTREERLHRLQEKRDALLTQAKAQSHVPSERSSQHQSVNANDFASICSQSSKAPSQRAVSPEFPELETPGARAARFAKEAM